jgi:uncharacterized protein YbaP (TraB family)
MRRLLAALSAALALCGCAQVRLPALPGLPALRPAPAQGPALWVIRDADSTIYLFGTVHVLRPDQAWLTPRIEAALDASDELVIELAEVDDPEAMMPLVQRHGLDLTRRLRDRLSPADRARLEADAAALGANPAVFDQMRPWMAALQLSVGTLRLAGYNAEAGVDRALKARAVAAGKPVRALETAEQQIRLFADMPPDLEMRLLGQSLDEFDTAPKTFGPLSRGWLRGDLRVLERYLVGEWKDDQPGVYRRVIVERNARWAAEIARMLSGRGTSFIAVGAGHLVGPDSVQAQLRRRGVNSARL